MCICTLNVMQSFPQKLKVERQQNTVVLLFGENPDVMIYVHIYVRVYVRALPHSIPNQFVQRLLLFIIPDKYKPDYEYLRHIPNRKIYLYTLVQVVFLGLLCVFKVVSQISIVFPVMVCTCTCTCTYNNTCIHMSGFSSRHSGKGGGGQVEFGNVRGGIGMLPREIHLSEVHSELFFISRGGGGGTLAPHSYAETKITGGHWPFSMNFSKIADQNIKQDTFK